MANKKCLYKILSESSSKEAESFKKQFEQEHPEIIFRKCQYRCSGYFGYNGNCENYKVKE